MISVVLMGALATVQASCSPQLRFDADLPSDVAEALCEEWAVLPEVLRKSIETHPLTVDWNRERAPNGLGDGTSELPEWRDGLDRFQLYAFADTSEHRAAWRLEALTVAERERLWRRRALVHALVRRWDVQAKWSESSLWRRATGWLGPFDRPLTWSEERTNTSPDAYSRMRGTVSAALDLATFAEEALAPVEAIRPDALPVDDRVACQEFSRGRALRTLLGMAPPEMPCPAFERWAHFDTLEAVEILFVVATGRRPDSLFGHMAIRMARRPGDLVESDDFSTVVQLVALTGGEPNGLRYVGQGLAGGYPLVALTTTLGDVVRESTRFEQRTIRRFRLKLTAEEQHRLVERLWEAERRTYRPYYFFTENCASEAIALINGALDPPKEVKRPGSLWVAPSAVLDAFGDLIEEVPDPLPSSVEKARQAEIDRDEALRALEGVAPTVAVRLRAWKATDVRPIQDALAELPETSEARSAAYEWLRQTVVIERAAVDLAEGDRLRILMRAVADYGWRDGGEDVRRLATERQREFERESELQTRTAALSRQGAFLDSLERATHRPFTSGEEEALRQDERAVREFQRLLQSVGDVMDQRFADIDPVAWDARSRQQTIARNQSAVGEALTLSGMGRLQLGGGAAHTPTGWLPTLLLRTAGLAEALGDQRRHGYQPGTGLRLLDAELELSPRAGWPELVRSSLVVIAVQSIARPPAPLRRSLLDWVGWGFNVDWEDLAARPQPQQGRAYAEILFVVHENETWSRLVVLGLGVEGRLCWGGGTALFGGARASLAHRLPLGGARALRIEAAVSPGYNVLGHAWATPLEGSVQLEVPIRSVLVTVRGDAYAQGSFQEYRTSLGLEWM